MSLVSNFIGEISSSQFGGLKNITKDFDMNDKTFADILEKQLNTKAEESKGIDLNSLGMPAGINIEPIEDIDFSENAIDQAEVTGDLDKQESNHNPLDYNNDGEVTTSEAATFFTSLLDNTTRDNSKNELFDFAKKQATNLYHKYSRNVITDMNEFVEDIKELM